MSYDIAIIGGGPAGLSAAINATIRGKRVVVLSNGLEGNPLWKAERVDNYPGLPGLTGIELLEAYQSHALAAGAEIHRGRVLNTVHDGERWYLGVGAEVEEADAVVLAAGIVRGKKFPGEERLLGAGVSYCATCDGMLYRKKRVAVLGFDEDARREADFLRELGCEVLYFDRPRQCEIEGESRVERVSVDGEVLEVEGVFLLRPAVAPTELFPGLAVEGGFVQVDRQMATNLPGLFAAGDCTGGPLQAAKAVGEGLVAGQKAAAYVDRQKAKSTAQ